MPLRTLAGLVELFRLSKNSRLEISELEEIQCRKFKRLINHAYNNVDYYRRKFAQAGILPSDIRNKSDIAKIPITVKSQIQGLGREETGAMNVDTRSCFNLETSASTGGPLRIILSEREYMATGSFYLRMQLENGYSPTESTVCITAPQYIRADKRWFHRLGIGRIEYISCFEDVDRQVEKVLKTNPKVIRGIMSSVKNLAIEIQRRQIKHIHPKLIFCTAEFLSEKDRGIISGIFGGEVFDYYSTAECGNIAWECSMHKGYHINIDNVMVECIKDGVAAPAGEKGEIVITALNNYTMPLIRYQIGDVGILGTKPCPCGRILPLLESLCGRTSDQIILSGRKAASPNALFNIIESIPGIVKYQIIQMDINRLRVNIIKNNQLLLGSLARVRNKLRENLNDDAEVEITIVDEIPQEKGHKYKPIVSMLTGNEYLQ